MSQFQFDFQFDFDFSTNFVGGGPEMGGGASRSRKVAQTEPPESLSIRVRTQVFFQEILAYFQFDFQFDFQVGFSVLLFPIVGFENVAISVRFSVRFRFFD